MSFWVVKYDVASFKQGANYTDLGVEAPSFIRPSYATRERAEQIAEGMSKSNCGEDIDIVLSNGKPYKGPRYIYRVAEDNKPAEEEYYAEKTSNPVD
jgi:hypothetical protein